MPCCGPGPSEYSPEHNKVFKFENNAGCCCSGNGDCDTPSRAREGSPLWKWEQIHGKLVTIFTTLSDVNGHSYVQIERKSCPASQTRSRRTDCCSIRYRVIR